MVCGALFFVYYINSKSPPKSPNADGIQYPFHLP
jgi:hypothetical protein